MLILGSKVRSNKKVKYILPLIVCSTLSIIYIHLTCSVDSYRLISFQFSLTVQPKLGKFCRIRSPHEFTGSLDRHMAFFNLRSFYFHIYHCLSRSSSKCIWSEQFCIWSEFFLSFDVVEIWLFQWINFWYDVIWWTDEIFWREINWINRHELNKFEKSQWVCVLIWGSRAKYSFFSFTFFLFFFFYHFAAKSHPIWANTL